MPLVARIDAFLLSDSFYFPTQFALPLSIGDGTLIMGIKDSAPLL